MSTINDGGPAFPSTEPAQDLGIGGKLPAHHQQGMSLRAYFAGEALPCVYKNFWDDARAGEFSVPPDWCDGIAQECFAMADALLSAMERKA